MTTISQERTYEELRSNAERIADEAIKQRVLAGMALLQERWGPDWVEHIEPASLDLADSATCVLGQLYDRASVSDEEWHAYRTSPLGQYSCIHSTPAGADGYSRGLAIIDGALTFSESGPTEYGFDTDCETYGELTEAWWTALGCDGLYEYEGDE